MTALNKILFNKQTTLSKRNLIISSINKKVSCSTTYKKTNRQTTLNPYRTFP